MWKLSNSSKDSQNLYPVKLERNLYALFFLWDHEHQIMWNKIHRACNSHSMKPNFFNVLHMMLNSINILYHVKCLINFTNFLTELRLSIPLYICFRYIAIESLDKNSQFKNIDVPIAIWGDAIDANILY